MADKDLDGDGPSLELPSLGFGRKRRKDREAPASEPSSQQEPEVAPEPQPAPPEEPTTVLPVAPPRQTPPARPTPQPGTTGSGSPGTRRVPAAGATRVEEPAQPPVDKPPVDEPVGPARREVRFPALPPLPAVLLVGALVGLAAVLATYASLRLCDAATGTESCGAGPGFLMLLAILIALTYLGGWLLRGFGIGDAGSTSFLAVGLLAVVVMLFLLESLDEWWSALVVLLVAVVAYALSWRVTTAIGETDVPLE